MKPLLVKSDLSGDYYILTRYRIDGKCVVASRKYCVTDQVKELFPRYFKQPHPAVSKGKGEDANEG
jgi:hypothetical protein